VVVAIVALLVVAYTHAGVTLRDDPVALAAVDVQAFGGSVQRVHAVDADGHAVPLTVSDGRLTPRRKVPAGSPISVTVTVERPGWDGWLLGSTKREQITVDAPVAEVASQWVTTRDGGVPVRFSTPAAKVAYATGDGALRRHGRDRGGRRSVVIPEDDAAGTLRVAAAARSWETLGKPTTVRWFPPSDHDAALVSPAPGSTVGPGEHLTLTFARPVDDVLGDKDPQISDGAEGKWKRVDEHTIEFVPSGLGLGFDSKVSVTLPKEISAIGAGDAEATATKTLDWTVPGASTLRLHQLLAQTGYLPLTWTPSGDDVADTTQAQAEAAVEPPDGSFSWTYDDTPSELTEQWNPERISEITRGAVMMFQDEHDLTVDAIAGPDVWKALIADVIAGKKHEGGYSYVYVHRKVPQKLTLWHNGKVILTSPGNTGVPAAPTELGTFPVFEHLKVTTMSGTNPDGSHYNDPGVKWVSYFNGGDALHAFPRASFGTPQSLGCVELPEAAAKKVWPYTPIGTLVTIEN
jgi:peptidoglycan hydrolase-like protein with peptidoglycan-binding domain